MEPLGHSSDFLFRKRIQKIYKSVWNEERRGVQNFHPEENFLSRGTSVKNHADRPEHQAHFQKSVSNILPPNRSAERNNNPQGGMKNSYKNYGKIFEIQEKRRENHDFFK